MIAITKVIPQFGVNYDIGWLGFTRTLDLVGDAIAYGEQSESEKGYPSVNHVLIVIGDGQCVQAHIDNGVQRGPLSQYLDDPRSRVYFRKLRFYTPDLGNRVAQFGLSKVGCGYAKVEIAEMAAADTLVGRAVNELTGNRIHDELAELLTSPLAYICSQLGAAAVFIQPEFSDLPKARLPVAAWDPQSFFQEEEIFEPFINDCGFQTS